MHHRCVAVFQDMVRVACVRYSTLRDPYLHIKISEAPNTQKPIQRTYTYRKQTDLARTAKSRGTNRGGERCGEKTEVNMQASYMSQISIHPP